MASEAERIIGLYDRHARDFDRDRGRSLFEKPWLDRFLELLPPGGASILDIGCGSGEPIARYLIGQGHAVTGADSSPTLIGLCRSRFPESEWVVADMRRLALPGRRFDGLLAWDSLFHLTRDDQHAMLPVLVTHAAERAALMFTSGPAAGEAIGCYRGEPLFHASLDPAEYRALLRASGFEVVSHAVADPGCGGRTVWLAQRRRHSR